MPVTLLRPCFKLFLLKSMQSKIMQYIVELVLTQPATCGFDCGAVIDAIECNHEIGLRLIYRSEELVNTYFTARLFIYLLDDDGTVKTIAAVLGRQIARYND